VFEIDPEKILFIAAAALILLGPERLPGLAHRAGEIWSLLKGPRDYLAKEFPQLVRSPLESMGSFLSETVGGVEPPQGGGGPRIPQAPSSDGGSSGYHFGSPDLN
jgi:hypothetical protein